MVKNYPESCKGLLAPAVSGWLKARRQPYSTRFSSGSPIVRLCLPRARTRRSTRNRPAPARRLRSAAGPIKSKRPMGWYQGVFETIAAGTRSAIIHDMAGISAFLREPEDWPDMITVANHVFIHEADRPQFDHDVAALLQVAQQTYQPTDAAIQSAMPGAGDNRLYRKAVSTEILRNAFPDGTLPRLSHARSLGQHLGSRELASRRTFPKSRRTGWRRRGDRAGRTVLPDAAVHRLKLNGRRNVGIFGSGRAP